MRARAGRRFRRPESRFRKTERSPGTRRPAGAGACDRGVHSAKVAPVNSRAIFHRVARGRRAGLLALVAVFALAQLQGISHLASHLGRDHAAPHSLVCGECIASADAGAAPVPTVAGPVLALPTTSMPPVQVRALRTGGLPAAYRSRAPPATST